MSSKHLAASSTKLALILLSEAVASRKEVPASEKVHLYRNCF